jgi:hypothetical protein
MPGIGSLRFPGNVPTAHRHLATADSHPHASANRHHDTNEHTYTDVDGNI